MKNTVIWQSWNHPPGRRVDGDGTSSAPIASTSHSYSSAGTYTANLLNSANASVATATIVVSSASVSRWRRIDPVVEYSARPNDRSGGTGR
jgi:hypothetical protein